ncbi:MAG: TrkA family potassium uptake protein [Chloroflexota bacterium]|nr:MAG: TrkA family potassium uptake protein [Chloroflexota bacterium]
MYIIVAGGGKVGYYLGKSLVNEGHEVLVIEKDPRKTERIAEELGSVAVRGDACEASTLAEIGTARADVVVAVTGDDEDNLVICQVAKAKFQVPRTIARINNPRNTTIFRKLGIDFTVSSTDAILAQIEHELPLHNLIPLLNLKNFGLEIVEVKIPPNSPAVGKRVRELALPSDAILTAVIDQQRGVQIAGGETVLRAEDEIVAITRAESEQILRQVLTGL